MILEIILLYGFVIIFVGSLIATVVGVVGTIFREDWGIPILLISAVIFTLCVLIVVWAIIQIVLFWLCDKIPILFQCPS